MLLSHPYIVDLFASMQNERHVVLVLEFVAGGDMYSFLSRGRFSNTRAQLYTAQIVSALHYLHAQRIVYRDLKVRQHNPPPPPLFSRLCPTCSRKTFYSPSTATSNWSTLVLQNTYQTGRSPSVVPPTTWLQRFCVRKATRWAQTGGRLAFSFMRW